MLHLTDLLITLTRDVFANEVYRQARHRSLRKAGSADTDGASGRATLEEILYEPLRVLDQGFVCVVDYMGDDAAIVQAATGLAVIRRLLAGEQVEQAASGLSPREWRELMAALGRP